MRRPLGRTATTKRRSVVHILVCGSGRKRNGGLFLVVRLSSDAGAGGGNAASVCFVCRVGWLLGSVGLLAHGSNSRTLRAGSGSTGWHGVGTKLPSVARDGGEVGLPLSEFGLGLIEDIFCDLAVLEGSVGVAWDDRSVVDHFKQDAGILGEQDLLLGALDDGGSVNVVGFLELLAGDVGQLSFGDERLCFCADELLLEGDDLGGTWLLVFQLLDLVLDLCSGLVRGT